MALGDGAGLVEHHRVDFGGILQNRAAAHQDSAARKPSDRRDHGGGSRQNQSARAGHDQHRDGSQPIPGEIKCKRGGEQQGRQEIFGVAVREALYRRALSLGLLHQLDDAGQRGLRTRARDADAEQAVAIQRAGEDFITRLFVVGQRLAGDGAFVDAGRRPAR